LVVE